MLSPIMKVTGKHLESVAELVSRLRQIGCDEHIDEPEVDVFVAQDGSVAANIIILCGCDEPRATAQSAIDAHNATIKA